MCGTEHGPSATIRKNKTKSNIKFPWVRAAKFTAGKIAGLDVKTREDYLALIENSLTKNYQLMGDSFLKSKDLLDAAIDANPTLDDVESLTKKTKKMMSCHGLIFFANFSWSSQSS